MTKRKVLLLILTVSAVCLARGKGFADETDSKKGPEREKMRSRLEQLFIWRVSDGLQLTPEEENKFTAEYKKLSEERNKASQTMDDIVDKMSKEKDKKEKAKLLGDYKEASKKYSVAQQNEIAAMEKIFSTDQMVDYVLLKRDMLHKFRDIITTPGTAVAKSPDKKLKEPSVFQEK